MVQQGKGQLLHATISMWWENPSFPYCTHFREELHSHTRLKAIHLPSMQRSPCMQASLVGNMLWIWPMTKSILVILQCASSSKFGVIYPQTMVFKQIFDKHQSWSWHQHWGIIPHGCNLEPACWQLMAELNIPAIDSTCLLLCLSHWHEWWSMNGVFGGECACNSSRSNQQTCECNCPQRQQCPRPADRQIKLGKLIVC